ncbi:MAG: KEOPS complex N(6)-L-threonylcarbamoyladenine synthase Kae1 [Candidatus Micrarchaeota archaeon]|nr:KEOPS complex N(6)-L-threonylcarbamoyladenine synthase Kae1 [Candidatus Micrarchaeota archaeon]
MVKILGIESTAHTFGIGIFDSFTNKILANTKSFYKPLKEGIVPKKAADFHIQNASKTILEALQQANLTIRDIDYLAYSAGPGMGPCLQIGAIVSEFLARKYDKKIIPVNHPHAHVEITKYETGFFDPLILYVSGGNTQILIEKEKLKFIVMGETLDIGLGNLFDMFARALGKEFGHGSVVAALAQKGKNFYEMPYTVKGMNFSFSGLYTYATKMIGKVPEEDLCYSLLEVAFDELCEATERALMLTRKKQIIVCGGVAQNKELIKKLALMASEHEAEAKTCQDQYNADNGAMIAVCASKLLEYKIEPEQVFYDQKWRIDQLDKYYKIK